MRAWTLNARTVIRRRKAEFNERKLIEIYIEVYNRWYIEP